MSFTRARYITVCQQVLVTATTVAVGLSAAGVMTLTIVSPEEGVTASVSPGNLSLAAAETRPVKATEREVPISPVHGSSAGRLAPSWRPARANLRAAAETPAEAVRGFTTVGVVWDHQVHLRESDIQVQVRARQGAHWSPWTVAPYHDDHGPDAGSAEGRRSRPGTDPVVLGNAQDVQVRAATSTGAVPAGMRLAVIEAGKGHLTPQAPAIDTNSPDLKNHAAAAGRSLAGSDVSLAAMQVAPKPYIYSRAQWGADESWRDCQPTYGTIKAGYIHHTVNANDYTAAQVPGIIRSIYKYHTQTRGWCDVGYNFLVDKFGRLWEGRAGGVDRPVIGAHTSGYNDVVFAVSAIGNFDVARPPQAIVDADARLMAWKLSLYNINAGATKLWVKDAWMQAINGHRDSPKASTACPGRYLYARIPDIRTEALRIQQAAQTAVIPAPATMPAPTTTPVAASLPAVTLPHRFNLGGTAWPDLALKDAAGHIRVLSTNGMVGYAPPVASGSGWGAMNLIAATGDVTGDGKGDVIARNASNGYARVYPGAGDGHVARTGLPGSYAFRYANLITGVGDWDGDGRRDVVSRDRRSSALYLHRGLGGGRFAAPVTIATRWAFTRTTGAGDLTGDGRPDLVAYRATDQRLVVFPGHRGTTPGTAFGAPITLGVVGPITGLAGWGDQTGDGHPDIVVRGANGLTRILAGNGRGGFPRTYGSFTAAAGLTALSEGPMNGGRADLVGRDASGRLVVLRNNDRTNGNGWLASNLTRPGAVALVQVGDWDRDGRADLITREGDGGKILVVFPGLGDGRFGRGHSLGGGWGSVDRVTGVGDVTGDGYPDLAGSINGGRTIIWPGNGWNGIKAPIWAPSSLRVVTSAGAWANGSPAPMYLSTTRTFVPAGGTSFVGRIPGYDLLTGVGDANGDNRADVFARDGSGNLWMLPGKTTGGFGPRLWVASGFAGYQAMG